MLKQEQIQGIVTTLCQYFNIPCIPNVVVSSDIKNSSFDGFDIKIKEDDTASMIYDMYHEFRHVWQQCHYRTVLEFWQTHQDLYRRYYALSAIEIDAHHYAQLCIADQGARYTKFLETERLLQTEKKLIQLNKLEKLLRNLSLL